MPDGVAGILDVAGSARNEFKDKLEDRSRQFALAGGESPGGELEDVVVGDLVDAEDEH